jgi:ABC-2 type transport system permease protein
LLDDPDFAFREKSRPTKMIVIGDGDFGRNKFMATEGGFTPLPLGYDRYAGRVVYDNKEFLLNAINYLLDDADLIAIRSRTIILRTLDKEIVKDHKGLIQLLNVTIPFVIIGLMGVVLMWMRKRKYGKEA